MTASTSARSGRGKAQSTEGNVLGVSVKIKEKGLIFFFSLNQGSPKGIGKCSDLCVAIPNDVRDFLKTEFMTDLRAILCREY